MIGVTTGIDMLKIDRLTKLDPAIKTRFLQRVFTKREAEECAGRDSSLAGRFSAKEAAAKALGCGIGAVGWHDIEVLTGDQGGPVLLLHGSALAYAKQMGWFSWSVSITHTAEYASATVTALFDQI